MARASAVTLTAATATTAAVRHKAGHFPSISGLPVHLSSPGRLSHSTSSPFTGQSRQRDSVCLASHGLLNAPGDNNCFLNSAVQIFWHLDLFRRSFRRLSEHYCLEDACIFCGIKMLFRQFQESVDSALAPDMLRRALASTFADQQRFQLGRMDDAAECFETLLLRLHYHIHGSSASDDAHCDDPGCLPHRKFAMDLLEAFVCQDCQYSTEPAAYSQMVNYVTVEGLLAKTAEMRQLGVPSQTGLFGKLIRKTTECNNGGEQQLCRRCGSRNGCLKRTLTNRPDIVTVGLAWPSEKPKLQTIAEVLQGIDTNICLCHLYHSTRDADWASSAVHHLVGMVCFYGRHYVSFFYHSRHQQWMHFDDASVRVIGSDFSQVLAKCVKGHMQPLLLFYANPEFETMFGDDNRDERYQSAASSTLSHTSSGLSGSGELSLEEKRAAASAGGKPAPPRPPLRTVSRTTPPYHSHRTTSTVPFTPGDRVAASSITTTTTAGPAGVLDTLHMSGDATGVALHCHRKNSRASVTSSGLGASSLDSFDVSLLDQHLRSEFSQKQPQPRGRHSIGSNTLGGSGGGFDETDSGCTSSSTTSSSSIEVPAVKKTPKTIPHLPSNSFTSPTPPADPRHFVKMMLRADDLILSGCRTEEQQSDHAGAIKLFEQAAALLESCVEPLAATAGPYAQFAAAVAEKQRNCYQRLHALHDKVTAHRSASNASGATSSSGGAAEVRLPAAMKILPCRPLGKNNATTAASALSSSVEGRRRECGGPVKLTDKYEPPADQTARKAAMKSGKLEEAKTSEASQPDGSEKRVNKSKRKSTVKKQPHQHHQQHHQQQQQGLSSLGSRENNRSMPDLSLNGDEKNHLSHSGVGKVTTMASFKASPTSYATMRVRSAAREILLHELSQRFQRQSDANSYDDESDEENSCHEEEFPPPPPELLLPLSNVEPEDVSGDYSSPPPQPCTLCGRRRVSQTTYCQDCQVYLSRFSRQL